MNRYTIAGMLADMRAGRTVLLLSENTDAARDAFDNIAVSIEPGEVTVRTHGHERIQADGKGAIRFRSIRSHLGELYADVVVFDCDRAQHWESIERVWHHFARLGKAVELVYH